MMKLLLSGAAYSEQVLKVTLCLARTRCPACNTTHWARRKRRALITVAPHALRERAQDEARRRRAYYAAELAAQVVADKATRRAAAGRELGAGPLAQGSRLVTPEPRSERRPALEPTGRAPSTQYLVPGHEVLYPQRLASSDGSLWRPGYEQDSSREGWTPAVGQGAQRSNEGGKGRPPGGTVAPPQHAARQPGTLAQPHDQAEAPAGPGGAAAPLSAEPSSNLSAEASSALERSQAAAGARPWPGASYRAGEHSGHSSHPMPEPPAGRLHGGFPVGPPPLQRSVAAPRETAGRARTPMYQRKSSARAAQGGAMGAAAGGIQGLGAGREDARLQRQAAYRRVQMPHGPTHGAD